MYVVISGWLVFFMQVRRQSICAPSALCALRLGRAYPYVYAPAPTVQPGPARARRRWAVALGGCEWAPLS